MKTKSNVAASGGYLDRLVGRIFLPFAKEIYLVRCTVIPDFMDEPEQWVEMVVAAKNAKQAVTRCDMAGLKLQDVYPVVRGDYRSPDIKRSCTAPKENA